MQDGHGSVALADDATYTLDPQSKVLRREAQFERYRQWKEQEAKRK
jgi:hypothetical protein